MKVNIPKVVRPLPLSDYAPEFGEQVIEMWVNPPRAKRLEFADITRRYKETLDQITATEDDDELQELVSAMEALAGELHEWYAEMWSQGKDKWTAEEVKEFAAAALDTDPGLWDFVQEGSLDTMAAYRRQKKASSPEPQR